MSDALALTGFYIFGALMCAFLLSGFAENRKQALVALAVSLVWPLAGLALAVVCFFIIGEGLFGLAAKALRRA